MTKIELKCYSLHRSKDGFTISFQDGKTRCHIWASGPGEHSQIIHRNTPTGEIHRSGAEETKHRIGDLSATKYAKIRQQIDTLTQEDFDAARKARETQEAQKEAKEAAERRKTQIERLKALAEILGAKIACEPTAAADTIEAADFIIEIETHDMGKHPADYWRSDNTRDINSGWRVTGGNMQSSEWIRVKRTSEI